MFLHRVIIKAFKLLRNQDKPEKTSIIIKVFMVRVLLLFFTMTYGIFLISRGYSRLGFGFYYTFAALQPQ